MLRLLIQLLGQVVGFLLAVSLVLLILWGLGVLQKATSERRVEKPETHLIEL